MVNLKSKGTEILKDVQNYFDNKKVGDNYYNFIIKTGESYAWIYKKRKAMINLRVRDGLLKDICLFIEGKEAKHIFEKLLTHKEEIETKLGYELAWDKNIYKQAVRVGRFFKGMKPHSPFELDNFQKNFGFNIEDKDYVVKVANEIVKFYKVIIPVLNLYQ